MARMLGEAPWVRCLRKTYVELVSNTHVPLGQQKRGGLHTRCRSPQFLLATVLGMGHKGELLRPVFSTGPHVAEG